MKTPEFALQHTYCIMRCNRWGRYERWLSRSTSDPRPRQMVSSWGSCVLDGNVEQIGIETVRDICPVDIGEARETQACIDKLPEDLQLAMKQEHIAHGKQQEKARALGIDRTAYWRRCERAYVLLLGCFNDVAAGLDIEDSVS